ncbi:hypothetical protein Q8V56_003434 [Vibrio cholerae]|nr:hypothetical protein [Vibrio cholerae]EGR0357320.1 hypothetical protein [Vibrio cholerae]ELI0377442.1 hypothetical protein [Vibrio cholerae]
MYVSPGVVVGFHGCDRAVFDSVIKNGSSISNSENDYDWLGHGVYFWEGSYERALDWAKNSKKITKPAVIGAFIKLGNCIDLLDSKDLKKVKSAYDILELEFNQLGQPLPQNKVHVNGISFVRELDCQVILRLQQMNNELIVQDLQLPDMAGQNKRKVQNHSKFIDSVRGMFPEGSDLYSGAGFRDKNHIQLCVVNPNCIIGYFDPIQHNNWYKKV